MGALKKRLCPLNALLYIMQVHENNIINDIKIATTMFSHTVHASADEISQQRCNDDSHNNNNNNNRTVRAIKFTGISSY